MDKELSLAQHYLESSIAGFKGQKLLGDRALSQLDDCGIALSPDPESNSIAVIVKHVAGNMISRWTDFLTTDGEKPNRNRDDRNLGTRLGGVLFHALEDITPEDLLRTVTMRGQAHTVLQAIHRQISHYGYHVGQIVYLAKAYKSAEWQTLSVAKGGSDRFNEEMKKK
jgi:hypothetical protein